MRDSDGNFQDASGQVYAHYDKKNGAILIIQRHKKSENDAMVLPLQTWVDINSWLLEEGDKCGF